MDYKCRRPQGSRQLTILHEAFQRQVVLAQLQLLQHNQSVQTIVYKFGMTVCTAVVSRLLRDRQVFSLNQLLVLLHLLMLPLILATPVAPQLLQRLTSLVSLLQRSDVFAEGALKREVLL
jgi:hypothetical protein